MNRRFVPFRLLLLLTLACLWLVPASAQQVVERIAAVVNDDVISTSDIEARLRLDLMASGLQPSAQNQQRLLPGVLRNLINEKLQLQEAERYNVQVSDGDIDQAVGNIAGQNGMSVDRMTQMLAQNGIPLATLQERMRSEIAWTRLTQRRFAPTISIGAEEVEEVVARYQANQGLPEHLVAEIFLAVDDPQDEREMRQFADQLAAQIRQGVTFASVARQFSQSAGAANGGDIGWVVEGRLDPALDAALAGMRPGEVSSPVRSPAGYHVLLLRERRRVAVASPDEAVVTLKRLALAIPPGTGRARTEQILATAQRASATLRGCDALAERASELGVANLLEAGRGPLREMPAPIRDVISGLDDGEPSRPVRLPDGVVVFMLCDRELAASGLPSAEQIQQALTAERLNLLRRRYLRDLRNAAFIDVRV
ncbi:MAG: hypothetical protein HKM95_18390 [Inquilinus sp.]|nr:hypothetical protein [Inquilinus sp.]